MGIVSIWSFDNYYSLFSDQILQKCDIFQQRCQTYLAFFCVLSKVLQLCVCATLQQERYFACIIRVVIDDVISD